MVKKGRAKGLSKRIAAVLLSVALMMDGTAGTMTVNAAQDVTASKQEVNTEEVNAEEAETKNTEEVNTEEAETKSIEESSIEESNTEEAETETKKTEETETQETETKTTEETSTEETETETKKPEETITEEIETETEETETETESETETDTESETELTEKKKLGTGNDSEEEVTVEEEGVPDFVFQAGGFSVMETENEVMGLSDGDGISLLSEGDMDALANELYIAMKAKQTEIDISKYKFNYTEDKNGEDRKKLLSVYYAVVNDHPELYYVRTAYSFAYTTETKIITKIKPKYFTNLDDAAFEAAVTKAKSVVTDDMDDIQKAIAIHDYLVLTCEYDKERLANHTIPNESYAAYGALVNHIAVCQGYALAFKYLMNELGITCYVVTSDEKNHAWNMVVLNGQNYQLDATWDDPTWDRYGLCDHKYMFISDDLLDNDKGHYPWYVTKGSGTITITATDTTYDNYFWRDVVSPLTYDSTNSTYYYVEADGDLVKKSYTKNSCAFSAAENVKTGIGTMYSGLSLSGRNLYYNTPREIRQLNLSDRTEKVKFALEESDSSQIYGFTRFDNITKYVKALGKTTIYVVDDFYTVTFVDAEGNVISTQKVPEGGTATPPSYTPPVGYQFTGWQGKYQNVMGNETVTATSQIQTYRISYNLDGGKNHASNPSTYTVETESFVLEAPTPPAGKEYLSFMGWYLDKEFTEMISSVEKGSTGNLTLYAFWEDNRGIWATDMEDHEYTGRAITSSTVKVYNGGNELTAGQDYIISYQNNINVANASAKNPPSLVITAKGNYAGTLIKTFSILPVSMDSATVNVQKMAAVYQKGKTQKPIPTVTWNGVKLKNGTDFTVRYTTNPSAVGTYQVTVTGKGNFTGTTQTTLTITDNKDKIAMSSVKIAKKLPNQEYSASGVRISEGMITLKYKNETLTPGTDYAFVPETYTNSGTNYVTIEGKGDYVGELRTTFKINGTSVSSLRAESLEYAGETLKPVISDKDGSTLREGTDYEINSLIGTEATGTAKVNITGKGAYYGTATKTFKITPHFIDANDVTVAFVKAGNTQPYEKSGAKPKVQVTYKDSILEEGTDYTLGYKGNKSVGATATVTIKGKKNFKGSREMSFTVGNSSLANVSVYVPDKVVSSKAGGWYSTPVLTDTNGAKLKAGTDYEKTIVYTCGGNTLDKKKDKVAAGQEITVTITGRGNYSNSTVTATYRILSSGKDISKATSVKVNKTLYYDGNPVTLSPGDITVKIGKTTVPSSSYEIVPGSYINNRKKGTAKVQIRGIEPYGGVKTVSFKINAQKMK